MELVKWLRLQWDRAIGVISMLVGIVLIVVGWIQVSGTEFVAEQIPYVVSAGLGGLVGLLLGGTLWLSADLRDEWRALDRLDEHLVAGDELVDDLLDRVTALEAQLAGSTNGRPPRTGTGGRSRASERRGTA